METKAVLDDRLDCPDRITMVTSRGPESTTFIRQPASNMTSTQPVFAIQLPSYATGCSRRVMWNMKGTLRITGTALAGLIPNVSQRIAFRQFPLQSACSSIQVQINDTLLSLPDPSKYLHGLLRKGITSKSLAGPLSMVNAVPDTVNTYENEFAFKHAIGASIFNPAFMQGYSNYSNNTRTIGMGQLADQADGTSLEVEIDIHEPLVCPPFEYSPDSNTKSIFGVNTIQVSCNMAHIHRMLSIFIPEGTTVTGVTLTPTEQHLSINYVTPPPSLIREGRFIYGYTNVQAYSFPLGNVNQYLAVSGSSGVIDLPVIPKGFIVYVTPSDNLRNDPTQSIPNVMLPITAIQCSFHTKAGLLASADQIELYNNNLRNGIEFPYSAAGLGLPQFYDHRDEPVLGSGNILYIDTAADLSLPEDMVPGMSMKTQFSVTSFTAFNNTGLDLQQPEIHILALTDGCLMNDSGSSSQQLGGVSPGTVSDCNSVLRSDVERLQREGGFGGKFSLGKALKKLAGTVSRTTDYLGIDRRALARQGVGQAVGFARGRFGGGVIGGYAGCPPKRSLRDYGGMEF